MSGQSFEGVGRWVIGALIFIGWAAAALAAGTGVAVWLGGGEGAWWLAFIAGWAVFLSGMINTTRQVFPDKP